MIKIARVTQKTIDATDYKKEERVFTDELDVKRFVGTVDGEIQDVIGSNEVLAKLADFQREYYLENMKSAFYFKTIQLNLINKRLEEKERKTIEENAEKCFRIVMDAPRGMAVLHRNVSENPLPTMMLMPRHEEQISEATSQRGAINKIIGVEQDD